MFLNPPPLPREISVENWELLEILCNLHLRCGEPANKAKLRTKRIFAYKNILLTFQQLLAYATVYLLAIYNQDRIRISSTKITSKFWR